MTKTKRTGAKATGTTTKNGGSKWYKEWKKLTRIKKLIYQQIATPWKIEEFHKVGLHQLEVYIYRCQNVLAQHLATSPIHQQPCTATRLCEQWTQHPRVQPPPPPEALPPTEPPILLDTPQPPPVAALPPTPVRTRASLPPPRPIPPRSIRPRLPPSARDLSFREDALVGTHLWSRNNTTLDHPISPPSAPYRVNRRDFITLRPKTWVSDEAIAGYLKILLAHHNNARNSTPGSRCAAFSPFFITLLLQIGNANPRRRGQYDYQCVKRWGRRIAPPGGDIFDLDKLFIPINVNGSHWVAIMIFFQEQRLQFYDSMGSSGTKYLRTIYQYLRDEHQTVRATPLSAGSWRLIPCSPNTPRQSNRYDCGVFTCFFADRLFTGHRLRNMKERDVASYRAWMAHCILQGRVS